MPGRRPAAVLPAAVLALALAGSLDAGAAGIDSRASDLPDQTDMAALEALHQAMEAARRTDPELPYDKVIDNLRIRSGTASFSNEPDARDGSMGRFPRKRPAGVSAAEWRALLASRIDGGGENGRASYMLLDLDGDGQRDLVIDTYTGGTGMYSSIRALRQTADRFSVPGAPPAQAAPAAEEQPDAAYLYALNGRGGNQGADWIRLGGRVYAVYRDSRYGVDNIYLLRPWHGRGQVPRLVVRYRYALAVPVDQPGREGQATRLAPALHRALEQAAALAAARADTPPAQDPEPLCPLPADAPDEVRDAYSRYGPGHYTFEIVADVPVLVGAECHIGQLRNWFGGYTPGKGLDAQLCVRPAEEPEHLEDTCYAVSGPRTVAGMTADVVPFESED